MTKATQRGQRAGFVVGQSQQVHARAGIGADAQPFQTLR
jgi:hypothetical protein